MSDTHTHNAPPHTHTHNPHNFQEWQPWSDQISTIRRRSSWQGGHSKARKQVLQLWFAEPAQDSITISRCHGDLSFHLGLAWSKSTHQMTKWSNVHTLQHGCIHNHIQSYTHCIALSLPILRRRFTTYGSATDGLYCPLFIYLSQWSHSSLCLTHSCTTYFLHWHATTTHTHTHNHTPVGLPSWYQIGGKDNCKDNCKDLLQPRTWKGFKANIQQAKNILGR